MSAFSARLKHRRRGSATVELAICLPLVTLLSLSAIEVSSKIFLQETLTQAAYEGALVAARQGGTTNKAQANAAAVLNSRNVRNFSITFSRDVATTVPGTQISITITAPVANNSLLPGQLYPRTNLNSTLTFVKEAL